MPMPAMEYKTQYFSPLETSNITPRIILHGGAGNITRQNLPPKAWHAYRSALLRILRSTHGLLSKAPHTTAIEAAVHAVQQLEDDPLFNAGKGAVFNREGRIELEASVMVSRGSRKRGVGVSLLRHVKSPITLAKELLVRGEEDDGGGAYGHNQISGEEAERLAESWGLELVDEKHFWTRKRWDEHKRGLKHEREGARSHSQKQTAGLPELEDDHEEIVWPDDDPSWDPRIYLPQGTVGCVVLDSFGTVCVATSTGGITNKIPGRLGDTPTIGAGFWAEEWIATDPSKQGQTSLASTALRNLKTLNPFSSLATCLPLDIDSHLDSKSQSDSNSRLLGHARPGRPDVRAVAMSGTGNGDSFLRVNAVRTAAAISRFSILPNGQPIPLAPAINSIAGPNGELQRAAGPRWGLTGEGEGGIIGIQLVGTQGTVHYNFNCGGLFRAWIDNTGKEQCMVFRDEY